MSPLGMSAFSVGELELTDKQHCQGGIRTDKRRSHSRRDDGSYNDEENFMWGRRECC
jgi:hypothetical protein